MSKDFIRLSVLTLATAPALLLSACGDNLEPTPYHGVPYTDERTAGTGVAYVRAKMLPPKETKTEAVTPAPAPAAPAEQAPPPPIEAPVTQGDKIFDNKQSK